MTACDPRQTATTYQLDSNAILHFRTKIIVRYQPWPLLECFDLWTTNTRFANFPMRTESTEKLWLADYEIESFLSAFDDDVRLKYQHPDDDYRAVISNLDAEYGTETPLLSVQFTFTADDIHAAEDLADRYCREFLYFLSFVTNSKFRIHQRNRLIDWSPGLTEREQFQYKRAPPDQPFPYLSETYLETVSVLQSWEAPATIRRALRWFAAGVAAETMEDQFQYFWFVVELLAVDMRDPGKVPDRCPVCRTDLYCSKCEQTPTHRPYPKQSIRELFRRNVSNEPDKLFEKMDEVRNMLMHGAEREVIEARLENDEKWKIPLNKVVDLLGSTAWTAILNSFIVPPGRHKPTFVQVSTYVNREMTMAVHAIMGSPGDPHRPRLEDQPTIQMDMIPVEGEEREDPSKEV